MIVTLINPQKGAKTKSSKRRRKTAGKRVAPVIFIMNGKEYRRTKGGALKNISAKKGKSNMAKRRKKRSGARRKRRRTRRNPAVIVGRRNPRRRRRRRSYRRNPAITGGIRRAFSRENIINVASLGVGFIGGIKAQKYMNQVEFFAKYRRWTGLIPFILGTIIAARGRAAVRSAGAGVSLSGLYDLVSQNIPALKLAPVEGIDLNDVDGALDIDMDGLDIDVDEGTFGQDDVEIVGDDDEVVVGEDDSPYMRV
jgi:hypothetical protein